MFYLFLDTCCNRFDLYVAYVFTHMLQQYFPKFFICLPYVAVSVLMLQVACVLSGCCICFHTYVASVCFKCFSCFKRMLQVFYLDVAYVFTHMLQVYVPSVLEVCRIQVFHAIRRVRGRRGIGRGEPVADGRGMLKGPNG